MSTSTHSRTAPAARGQCEAIDLSGKIALVEGHWQPRVVAEMNDYQFKVVKIEGEFVWHKHGDTDETFLVLDGELRIDFRGGPSGDGSIVLRAGQMSNVCFWRIQPPSRLLKYCFPGCP
ncbi:hypothetical protein LIG30_3234 [Burkholderia sp. lig30]|uniref:cupin domain-containing protein n=1 Tax=Burkholderia sp. lig30 TaxID=1192124 RepID=UPI000461C10E|nr:cupin domain-containing protein [Burkholderia sp. lig30]KDB07712.1 hypothetical protein LIG30_3234 [Burkholderia sp. lig30]